MQDKMDIVVTWVDGNDKTWLKERQKYLFQRIMDKRALGDAPQATRSFFLVASTILTA